MIIFGFLRKCWQKRQKYIQKKYKRTLPFGEYVVDRWDKARALGFGKGSSVYDSALVYGDVRVGDNTWVGPFVILDGTGGLEIGSNCSISAGVQIYTHDSVNWAISGGKEEYELMKTKIGDCCYIGPNVVIAKGVEIGDGCVIGANSVVLSSIKSGSKAYGSPCVVQGKV